ncbi:Sterol 3-beta-glucosyltransferase [Hondaea fermentalgiana]|uniref:Sterol 3-beta-glucosyltransferase n=1 Tax=Hondaea fermentalgiana TaxID=2315210 RepID=A0A2R5GN02_9STRA|nr:Sterol 3-beta-glucosyltransferase [Hondaea fermentalgiana]|eukprot:GBG31108.1 Sterol 3-beta-glucosyltransferase [Hondaea fermentalgiana]
MGNCCSSVSDRDRKLAAYAAPDGKAPQEIGLKEITRTQDEVLETSSAPGPLQPTSPQTPATRSDVPSDDEDDAHDDIEDTTSAEREEREEFHNMACIEKRVRYEFDTDVDEKNLMELSFVLEGADHVAPDDKTLLSSSNGVFVRINVYDGNGHRRRGKIETRADRGHNGHHTFNLRVVVENANVTDVIKLSAYRSYLLETARHKIGRTLIPVKDLMERREMPELWLFSGLGVPIFDRKLQNPTTLCIRAIESRKRAPMLSPQQFALSVGNFAASEGATAASPKGGIQQLADEARAIAKADEEEEESADESGNEERPQSDADAIAAADDEGKTNTAETEKENEKEKDGGIVDRSVAVVDPDAMSENSDSSHASYMTMSTHATLLSEDISDEESVYRDSLDENNHLLATLEDSRTDDDEEEEEEEEEEEVDYEDDSIGDHERFESKDESDGPPLVQASGEEYLKEHANSAEGDHDQDTDHEAESELEENTDALPVRNDVSGSRRLLVISRGTRGDVQPFIALARGLAECFEWEIYICTEMRYKPLIEKYCDVERGSIHFVPSGGDTEARIAKPIAKWAVNTKLRLMQAAMLARMEREFFDSEPAFFYWAKRLQPDFLCYTFTTANLAFIISEALRIPMIGFFLQPTCLPSKSYTPITPLRRVTDADASELSAFDLEGHETFRRIKRLMENNLFTSRLDDMYRRRGISRSFDGKNDFEVIVDRKFPIVVPIKEEAFGGKPPDWPVSTRMSDFIFLRTSGVPPLSDEIEDFIQSARDREYPVMCICFSSMPVTRIKILQSALHILDKCPGGYKPCIIALVGNRPDDEQRDQSQEARAEEYAKDKRLIIVGDFNDTILDILPKALAPDSAWKKKAREIADTMFPGGIEGMSNGVEENAEVFRSAAAAAFPAPGTSSTRRTRRHRRIRSRGHSVSSRGSRGSVSKAFGKLVHLPSPVNGHRRNSSHGTAVHHDDHSATHTSDSDEVATLASDHGSPLAASAINFA